MAKIYLELSLTPILSSTLYKLIYLIFTTKYKVDLLLAPFHRWEISQMGYVIRYPRLTFSTWAKIWLFFLTSLYLFYHKRGPGQWPGVGSGEGAPQSDNEQGWALSLNQQSIHQPIDPCGRDPAWWCEAWKDETKSLSWSIRLWLLEWLWLLVPSLDLSLHVGYWMRLVCWHPKSFIAPGFNCSLFKELSLNGLMRLRFPGP